MVEYFDPPLDIQDDDLLHFACHYDNPDDVWVYEGGGASDEMCFVFGYYYPSEGVYPCAW